ncbi:MAG: alanine--tRNA ligase [Patescibacteria group bacterium]
MQSGEIRQKFLAFFEKRGHVIIPSSSLVPENDASVLFNTAGMQPLVPYLLGAPHPAGKRLVDVQKCVRTADLEDIGDNRHLSFFEMLGNWSLGDYFKQEAIAWSYEFLTSKTEGLGLDQNRLYVTCFAGDENAPRDLESSEIWKSLGVSENRIYFLGKEDNWWTPGANGPCGPDTEMFYDLTESGLGELNQEQFLQAVKEESVVEIWNDVFMEYEQKDGKVIGKLKQKNVDTGAGLERITAVMQGQKTAYDTDLFAPIMGKIDEFASPAKLENVKAKRIVADHIRTAVFMIADGVLPSNTDRGYVLRRLIRRAVRYADILEIKSGSLFWLAQSVIEKYGEVYENLKTNQESIKKEIEQEESKFRETLQKGLREFEKGVEPFVLFTSYGFPVELIRELAEEKGQKIDEEKFAEAMKAHQELSRAGAEKKFKGGLADHSEKVLQYHTATHLLHQALHDVLGEKVMQKGSNITGERLRFDFAHAQKMTDEEKKKVEEIVNQKIGESLPVQNIVLPKSEAEKIGARMFFGDKYGEQVSVYFIGESLENAYSKEFCGGPHVSNTSDLKGVFKITKEEAISAGVRRIKAVLE